MKWRAQTHRAALAQESDMDLARHQVELINPRVGGEAYTLLWQRRAQDWYDAHGNWHVVLAARDLPEIEDAERHRRQALQASGGRAAQSHRAAQSRHARQPATAFATVLAQAQAKLRAQEEARQRGVNSAGVGV